jgi:hypothetical protein
VPGVSRRLDRTSLVAGLVTIALGGLALLDRTDVIDVSFGYGLPAAVAGLGVILLTAGLEGPRPPR